MENLPVKFFRVQFLIFLCFLPLLGNTIQNVKLLQEAQQAYYRGDIEAVSLKINHVLMEKPENPLANILKGLILLQEEETFKRLEAKKIIEKYAARIKDSAFAYYALGILYKKQNILRKGSLCPDRF